MAHAVHKRLDYVGIGDTLSVESTINCRKHAKEKYAKLTTYCDLFAKLILL